MRAGLIGRRIRHSSVRLHDIVCQHPRFDFFATDVGQHAAVNLNARAEHLAALLDHFLALRGIVDDIAIFVGQIVFAENGAHALAPAT